MLPRRVAIQRIAGRVEGHVLRQFDGQLIGRNADRTTGFAVDHRDGTSPVPLTADAPVAQAVEGRALALTGRLETCDGGGLGGFHLHPVHEVGVEQAAGPNVSFCFDAEISRSISRSHDRDDGQAVFAGELEVALIVGRASEDGAGSVGRQHEIGCPDRHGPLGVERVADTDAEIDTQLLRLLYIGFAGPRPGAGRHEVRHVGPMGGDGPGQRMVGRERQEAGAEQGVGPGGVDLDGIARVVGLARRGRRQEVGGLGDLPPEGRAAALADPVLLHQPDLVGPAAFKLLQPLDQVVGIVGDAQEPLVQLALLDHGARTPAAAVDDLLIGEDGVVDRIPVDDRVLAIDQTALEQLEKPGLLLAVIGRIASGELAAPVQRQAQQLQLVAHGGDVGPGPVAGVDASLDGRVLSRKSESVPAHRMQDIKALRPLRPRHHVAHDVVAGVAHVDGP